MKLNLINSNAGLRIGLRNVALVTRGNVSRGSADPQGLFQPAPMTSACAWRIVDGSTHEVSLDVIEG